MKKLLSIGIALFFSTVAMAQSVPYGNDGIMPPSSNFYLAVTPWQKCTLTYYFSNYTADLSQANQRTAVINAFATWASVVNITFTELTTPTGADIIIGWGTGSHTVTNVCGTAFDGSGGTLAHAYFPGFAPLNGDVHFDDAETWSTTGAGITRDLQTVAVHEIGHAIGLDHSAVSSAVMFSFYSGVRRSLTSDDITGIRTIYPSGIQGPTSICFTGTNTYSFPTVPGSTTYTWTAGTGITILTGQGTNTITVSATPTITSGQLCVSTTNGCSTCRTVGVGSPMPSNITFSRLGSSCEYQATATTVVGATSYQWSQNNFATFYSTTGPVDANTYTSPSTVTLSVRAVTVCGTSAVKTVTRTLTRPAGCMARMASEQGTDEAATTIRTFPNPTDGQLTIEVPDACIGQTVFFYDLSGRVVHSEVLRQPLTTLDVSSFEAGLYLLRVETSSGVYTERVVVQE